MEFSRQEYWNGLPFPSPGDLPNPGIELGSPALQADSLPSEPPGEACVLVKGGSVSLETFQQLMRKQKGYNGSKELGRGWGGRMSIARLASPRNYLS